MAFNINDFHSSISKSGGFAVQSAYECFIHTPISVARFFDDKDLSFRISSVNLPGRDIAPIERRTYGPPTKIGAIATYADVSMSIILSPDLRERDLFLRWQDLIVGNHRNFFDGSDADSAKNKYDIGYPETYLSDTIIIRQYDVSDFQTPTYEIKLIDAYPSTVAPVQNSWDTSEPSRLDVTFTYRHQVERMNFRGYVPGVRIPNFQRSVLAGAINIGGQVLNDRLNDFTTGNRFADRAIGGAATAGIGLLTRSLNSLI